MVLLSRTRERAPALASLITIFIRSLVENFHDYAPRP
ncbi:Uncharacterised protein [Schaalia odontolytica]|uniref:Uncharacterized protein n=1 Tax=Schaalia odontolytica TaxID=1660 RepID=A0A6N2R851_9ACTO